MATKIFEINPYKWHVFDVYSSWVSSVQTTLVKQTKGLALSIFSDSNRWTNSSFPAWWRWTYSFVIYLKWIKTSITNKYIISSLWASNSGNIYTTDTTITPSSWTVYVNWLQTTSHINWKDECIVVNWITFKTTWLLIWNSTWLWASFGWYIYYVAMYSWTLTTTEIDNIQKKFISLQPIQPPKTNLVYPKPISLKETWLIGAWNMKLSKNTVYDISWNWLDITNVWLTPSTKWMVSNWVNGSMYCSKTTTETALNNWAFTFCWRGYLTFDSANRPLIAVWLWAGWWAGWLWIMCSNNNRFYQEIYWSTWWRQSSTSTAYTSWYYTVCTIYNKSTLKLQTYVNWLLVIDSAVVDPWTISPSTRITFSYLGSSTLYLKWYVEDCRLYSKVLLPQEIKNYHNQFAKRVVLKDNFSNDKSDSTIPRWWIAWTGTYKIGYHTMQFWQRVSEVWLNWYTTVFDNFTSSDSTWFVASNNSSKNSRAKIVWPLQVWHRYTMSFTASFTNCTAVIWTSNGYNGSGGIENWNYSLINWSNTVTFTNSSSSTADGMVIALTSTWNATMTISNFSLIEIVVPLIDKNNYLECLWAWTIAIPCKQVSWTYEFSFYKNGGTQPYIQIIASTRNDPQWVWVWYAFTSLSWHNVWIQRYTAWRTTIMMTNSGYILPYTWYRIRITRSNLWVFTTYIKWWVFNNWTAISTTWGTWTNPVTDTNYLTSNFFVISLWAWDRFSDLTVYEWVVV